jgi:hypothetical protein
MLRPISRVRPHRFPAPLPRLPHGRRPSGGMELRRWLGAFALSAAAALGCSAAAPPAKAPAPRFGGSLSLAMSLNHALAVGDKSVTASFTLTNGGSQSFDGCFGPSWGVSVIVEGDHDAGHYERADRPTCDKRFTLAPGETLGWSKAVPLGPLRAGTAKVTGWVKVVNPAVCDKYYGCRESSVATAPMTVAVGSR